MIKDSPFLYGNLFPVLWDVISEALLLCMEYKRLGKDDRLVENDPKLMQCFRKLDINKLDAHLRVGLYKSHQIRKKIYPRILRLTLRAFEDSIKINTNEGYIIPSPLLIIYHLLIVPSHSFTAAYSLVACRTFLFYLLNLRPVYISNKYHAGKESNNKRFFTEPDVTDCLNDFENFESLQLRWPKGTFSRSDIGFETQLKKPEIASFVGHFLATKGFAHLWFQDEQEAENFLKGKRGRDLEDFIPNLRSKFTNVKFRRSARYRELPDWGEILNQIFGFPIPIKGAEVVFFGGLRPASNGGLVVSVSGRAGVGKTSFALALAEALSPFGTKCFYVSLEEEINDIERRRLAISPRIQKDLHFFRKRKQWFFVDKLPGTATLSEFTNEIEAIGKELKTDSNISEETSPVRPNSVLSACPYIVVIDNLTELVADYEKDHYAEIERFNEACRKLGGIVILLSPEGIPEKLSMEYLVDVGIELKHKDISEEDLKPVRTFNLFKTRHQLSRQGSHVFHMSGTEGFRLSPQIPSQIDRKEKLERNLHDPDQLIHTLNFLEEEEGSVIEAIKALKKVPNINRELFIQLFPASHILVHGFGSAGKAGFATKLLLTPPLDASWTLRKVKNHKNYSHLNHRRKILIISFLYSEKYYNELIRDKINLQAMIRRNFPKLPDPIVEYLVLYPGYLTPQDFLNKVTRKLDEADLEGQPFTGVLVDGLHNVFLQFDKLQKSTMVWPMLYNILSRYPLTVVSTFTNFSLNDRLIEDDFTNKNEMVNQAVPDYLLLQQGMAPFLHALVKASDYYFFMEEHTSSVDGKKRYLLAVKSATGQPVPEEFLEWDRENNVFKKIYSLNELKQLLEKNR